VKSYPHSMLITYRGFGGEVEYTYLSQQSLIFDQKLDRGKS